MEFQYLIDPSVSGTVTMTIDTEMTRIEAWELFEHILWISGSYASKQAGFINILPFSKLPQERRIFAKHDPLPNVDVSIIRLFNTTASDMAGLIRPFMTPGATVSPIQYLNSLLVVEAPPNMDKLRELIEKLDVMGETHWPQISIPCYFVESSTILEELQQILPTLGFSATTSERGDGHSVKMVSLDRLQVIIASAPIKDVLNEIERWVRILDREDTVQNEQIFFYDVKYNTAEDLNDAVGTFFTASSTSSTQRSTRSDGDTTPRSTTRQQQNQRRNQQTATQRRNQPDEKPATVFDVPMTVLADGAHNRLVVKTTPRAFATLEAILQRLDSPPLQVLMQVTIAEIILNTDTEHGFRYAAEYKYKDSDSDGKSFNFDISPGTVANPTYAIQFQDDEDGDGMVNSPGDLLSFIQAVAGETNTEILFAPQVIAISDEEASINIGDSVPIATRTESGDTTTSRNFTDVQYQDTGIILTVTPHITAQEISEFGSATRSIERRRY